MFKKMMAVLLAFIVTFSMSACGDKDDNESEITTEDTTEAAEEETTVEAAAEEKDTADEAVLTGWEDLEFVFGGTEFEIPFEAGLLETNGWAVSGLEKQYDMDYVLEAGAKLSNVYTVSNSTYDSSIRTLVGFINNGAHAASVAECDVWSFICNIYDEANGTVYDNVPELKLAGGITWGSTSDEIKAAYGDSMKDIEGEADDYTVHMYMYNGTDIMKLTTRNNLGLVEICLLSYTE